MDWMISADSHIIEPQDLWTSRAAPDLLPHVPRVERIDGVDWWAVGDKKCLPITMADRAGARFEGREVLERKREGTTSDIREGAQNPHKHVSDNELDGVWGAVLYPSFPRAFSSVRNDALQAVFRIYNDWIAEFAGSAPGRLKGVAAVHAEDVGRAAAELERARKKGLACALISVAPLPGLTYEHPMYEPLWSAAEDQDMPLSVHIATNRDASDLSGNLSYGIANSDRFVRDTLTRMIFSGVFERHPKLRVISVEFELGWVPHWLERMDYTYTQRPSYGGWQPFRDGMVPSDFFRKNIFLTFQEDAVGIENLPRIGSEKIMWGSDYPHPESTYPRSRRIVERVLAGLSRAERRRITATNAATMFGFQLPERSLKERAAQEG